MTERKTIKNYCKYCDQAFLSKYVRDMHEKVKHGSGYVSAEKPKKMPVIKKPKKEPKSLQILPVKPEPNIDLPAGIMDFGQPPEAQFTDQDLLNFVDKKHQAMNKHGKKNQSMEGRINRMAEGTPEKEKEKERGNSAGSGRKERQPGSSAGQRRSRSAGGTEGELRTPEQAESKRKADAIALNAMAALS